MNDDIFSTAFVDLQTMVRKAFDPQTISVTVGRVNDASRRFRVIIRDTITKAEHVFHVNIGHTKEEIEGFIRNAAEKLELVEGPDSDTVSEGAHNHD